MDRLYQTELPKLVVSSWRASKLVSGQSTDDYYNPNKRQRDYRTVRSPFKKSLNDKYFDNVCAFCAQGKR